MSVKVISGYSHHCSNCNYRLSYTDKITGVNKKEFGVMIKKCPNCNQAYLTNNLEYFNMDKKYYLNPFYDDIFKVIMLFVFVFICWPLMIAQYLYSFIAILIGILVYIIGKYHRKKEYEKQVVLSKERLKDKSYMSDLIKYGLLSKSDIEILKEDKILKD